MEKATNWCLTPLKEITLKIGSGATPRGGKNAYKHEGIALIRSLNVHDFRFEEKDLARIDQNQADGLSNVVVEQKDILLNITGASVARCCMVPDHILPARVNQHVAIIRIDKSKANTNFVLNVINSPSYKHHLLALSQGGATREALTKSTIERFEVPLPELPVQQKIAAILSAYDDLIENNLRRIRILEEMAQNLYREWFVKFRFPGHHQSAGEPMGTAASDPEGASARDGASQQMRMVDSPLGKIPEGWDVKRVKDFGAVITGKTPSKKRDEYYGSDIPFVKTPDMHGNIFVLNAREYLSDLGAHSQSNKTLPAGTISVSCIGTVGIVSILGQPSQTNQQINSVVPSTEIYREFLFFALQGLKETIHRFGATGVTMANLSKGKFESLKIVCPTEQMVNEFHRVVFPMFEQIKNCQSRITTLRQTRDLLLPKLISGELDVSELEIDTGKEAA